MIISLSLGLAGCNEQNDSMNPSDAEDMQRFVGMWKTSEPIKWYIKPSFTFYENHSFAIDTIKGTYRVENKTLILEWDNEEQTELVYDYSFINNDTVQLTYMNTEDQGIYHRQ